MANHTLNVTSQLLCYADQFVTDNPYLRAFDHTRRLFSLPILNPRSDSKTIAPGQSLTVFDGTVAHSMTGLSTVTLDLLSAGKGLYRLSVAATANAFRVQRAVSGVTSCSVSINNHGLAEFDFSGASLAAVQVGDIMRVSGSSLNDPTPYAFNQLNSGIWSVIAKSGTKVSCVRLPGEAFSGATEVVASAASDVIFYSASGVQKGNKVSITGTLSPVSQKTFEVLEVTPTSIDFCSASPLPLESAIPYIADSISFYSDAKKMIYIEVDQEASVRFNADTSDNCMVTPLEAGNPSLVGFFQKWGSSYKCVVVNKSLNPLNLKYFTAE